MPVWEFFDHFRDPNWRGNWKLMVSPMKVYLTPGLASWIQFPVQVSSTVRRILSCFPDAHLCRQKRFCKLLRLRESIKE